MSSLTDPFPTIDQLPRRVATGIVSSDSHLTGPAAEAGYADGAARGYRDGREAGVADARGDLSFALTALHGAIEDLHRRDAAGIASLSEETVALALAIAETVIGREIDTAIDPGRDALVRALALAPERGTAVARFHPDDLALLGDLTGVTGGREIELVADHRVERGGCILEVDAARIDAQLSPALERIRAELTGAELARDDHPLGGSAVEGALDELAGFDVGEVRP